MAPRTPLFLTVLAVAAALAAAQSQEEINLFIACGHATTDVLAANGPACQAAAATATTCPDACFAVGGAVLGSASPAECGAALAVLTPDAIEAKIAAVRRPARPHRRPRRAFAAAAAV
jgi:hypothetical protein